MAAAQPKAESNSDGAIVDLEAGPRDCPVCMEAADWVAIGPCGHGEVCLNCAVRLRFHERNWRCCICRAFCPTVVVTKNAAAASASGGFFPKPPLAAGGAGQAGRRLSYHSGMAAYFDDQGQYEKARRMCLEPVRPQSRPRAGVNRSHAPAPPSDQFILDVILFVAVTIIGCGTSVAFVWDLFENWGQRIPVVIAWVFILHVIVYVFGRLIQPGLGPA